MRKNVSANYSVTTREYVENYLGIPCPLRGYMSYDRMEDFVMEKAHQRISSVGLGYISTEDILRGTYVLVRSEGSKKKRMAPFRAYLNPHRCEPTYLEIIDHQSPEENDVVLEGKNAYKKSIK